MSDAPKSVPPISSSWLRLIWLVAGAAAFVGGNLGIQALQARHPAISPLVFQAILGLQAAGFVLVLWSQVSARSHAFEFALLAILISFSGVLTVVPEILALYILDAVFGIRNSQKNPDKSDLYHNVMQFSFIFFFAQTAVAIALVIAGNPTALRSWRPDPGVIAQMAYELLGHVLPVIYIGGLALISAVTLHYLLGSRALRRQVRSSTGT